MDVRKAFWYSLMAGAIVLFAIAFGVGYFLFSSAAAGIALVAALVLPHVSEIPAARRAASGKRVSDRRVAVMTTIFGFTWWVPLKKGIIEK